MLGIKRREFITLLGGAAAWPLAVRAQQPGGKIWRLGILQPGAPPEPLVEAIRQRLRELGYIEGRNILLEYRWAQGKLDRLTDLATELVGSKVDVITTLSTPAALAARNATTTIPIVFTAVGDPVGAGVVPSLARPGGNATGSSLLATELSAKRLEVLREIVPGISRVAMLWNDTNPGMVLRAHEAQDAATKLGVVVRSIGVHDLIDFKAAFAAIERGRADALLTLVDPFTREHRKRIVDFAAQRRLPAIYEAREFVESGGLVSYGPSLVAIQRRAAEYVDKIFKGAKPADLPVEQPAKFELLINMKAANALNLTIPPSIILRADEVIE
ncbi:MAG TPA: ABC transporter substrate-binding protein [Pseudolabrys sp.]|nr:ABC transporter substrate-binding protein [Pseudolabrys sp.]